MDPQHLHWNEALAGFKVQDVQIRFVFKTMPIWTYVCTPTVILTDSFCVLSPGFPRMPAKGVVVLPPRGD